MGEISRDTVRRWLQNYETMLTGSPPDGDTIPHNGGAKPKDGITNRQLTKVMLDQALEALPRDLKQAAICRWLEHWPLSVTLIYLGITKDQYYYRCNIAVDCIYHYVNGKNNCK